VLTDFILASLHHIAAFSLAAIIAAEFILIGTEMNAKTQNRLRRIDRHYGAIAALVIVIGVARVIWGAKGAEYYLANHVFWTKMLLFAIVGVLSVWPTLRFIAWGKQSSADPTFRPDGAEVSRVRRYLLIEGAVFLCIPIAAAAMARGYGI